MKDPKMRKPIVIVATLLGVSPLSSQTFDMAVAQKWQAAKVVKYQLEGLHSARTPVVFGDYEGKADVTDRITLEFTWDAQKGKVISPIKVLDAKSQISNIKSDNTNCPPPQLKSEYEHFQAVSNSIDGDLIEIKGVRTYPAASVSNYPASCSMRAIPGARENVVLHIGAMGPEALAMPIIKGGPVLVSVDRKSFSVKGADNWVWTFTPTLLQ